MKKVFFWIVCLLLVVSVSATATVGEPSHQIQKVYSQGGFLEGWINLSLNLESGDTLIGLAGGSFVKISELLTASNNLEYTCVPENCVNDYISSNPERVKIGDLEDGQSKTYGILFNDEIIDIGEVNFKVSSNADRSCDNQISIDILSDGVIEFENDLSSPDACDVTKTYGPCYNEDEPEARWVEMRNDNLFCQRVTLPRSPGARLGLEAKKISLESGEIYMKIFEIDSGNNKGGCSIAMQPNAEGKDVYCDVEGFSLLEPQDFYICAMASADDLYEIKNYGGETFCGFRDTPPSAEILNYKIFAQGLKYAKPTGFNTGEDIQLGLIFKNYINETYRTLDCSSGCVVPISIISGANQKITLSELYADAEYVWGNEPVEVFHDLMEQKVKFSTEVFQKIELEEGNIEVPSKVGENEITLVLGEQSLFTETIEVKEGTKILGISPKTTAAGMPTVFSLDIEGSANISSYEWNFEGIKETSTENEKTHTFDSIGEFNVTVSVVNSNYVKSSGEFLISVESPSDAVNKTLVSKIERIDSLKKGLSNFEEFQKNAVEELLQIHEKENQLLSIQQAYLAGKMDQALIPLMQQLVEIKIPESVEVESSGKDLLFFPSENDIDLELIASIGGGASGEDYIDKILAWNGQNMETRVSFQKLVANYGGSGSEDLVTVYSVKLNAKGNILPIVMLQDLDSLTFEEGITIQGEDGNAYFTMPEAETTLNFYTTEFVGIEELPLTISPPLYQLMDQEIGPSDKGISVWFFFILLVILLLIVAVVIYVVLQKWYKRKYENYLFPNKNDLYNIVSYVQRSKRDKKNESETIKNLRKVGWSGEQIKYVMKKYKGRRTGMVEIPIEKITGKIGEDKRKSPSGPRGPPPGFGPRRF